MTKFLKYFFESNESFHSWSRKMPNPHIGEVWEVDHEMEPKHPLSHEQRNAVEGYSGASKHLNKALLSHHITGEELPDYHKAQMKHLDAVANRSIGKELHVHSGIGFDPREHFQDKGNHLHLHLPAYTSASASKDIASQFAQSRTRSEDKHILHIHMKPTNKGHYLGSRSMSREEHEVILPRNTKLKVNKTPEIHETDHGKYHIWHSEIEN